MSWKAWSGPWSIHAGVITAIITSYYLLYHWTDFHLWSANSVNKFTEHLESLYIDCTVHIVSFLYPMNHYTVHIISFIIYMDHCTVHIVSFLYMNHCTVHIVSFLYMIHFAVHIASFLYMIHCTVHIIPFLYVHHCTVHIVLCT